MASDRKQSKRQGSDEIEKVRMATALDASLKLGNIQVSFIKASF